MEEFSIAVENHAGTIIAGLWIICGFIWLLKSNND